jgi:Ca2+-binding EF-hand superfamily protein
LQLSTPMGITLSKQSSWKDSFNKFLQSGFLKSNEFKKIVADNLGHPTLNLLKIQN